MIFKTFLMAEGMRGQAVGVLPSTTWGPRMGIESSGSTRLDHISPLYTSHFILHSRT